MIPTRHFDGRLRRRVAELRRRVPDAEVLVVEPADRAGRQAAEATGPGRGPVQPVSLLHAPRGRGTQCNRGAREARGELLMFLHDDTDLPIDASQVIARAFADPGVALACFRLSFDRRHWLLGLYALFSRFDSVWTTFGDQGIVVRRSLFRALGGFPDWPLFEDVELGRRARRRTRIVKLPAAVRTSAVRFARNGVVRQQLRNAWLILRYLSGTAPEVLAACYERPPGPQNPPRAGVRAPNSRAPEGIETRIPRTD